MILRSEGEERQQIYKRSNIKKSLSPTSTYYNTLLLQTILPLQPSPLSPKFLHQQHIVVDIIQSFGAFELKIGQKSCK